MAYPFREIEPKWQKQWDEAKLFECKIDPNRPKYYILDMFPYPSGSGLHVGHVEGYTASDIIARYKRARGFNVLHPMGWDAFGLPAEQHAIQTGTPPEVTTAQAIANFKRQLRSLGFSYDWTREISTCDPKYYKWTQFIFTKLFERGLAYQKEMPVNWCPKLRTVLANEEVVDGKSERGGHPVEKRLMRQWMLKITAYAERLLKDLDQNDWHERTKDGQRNWIGRSEGLEGEFGIKGRPEKLKIFTTRPDTIFGVTFMVLAPEHPLVDAVTTAAQRGDVTAYKDKAARKSDLDRQAAADKTGVFTGAFAINPVNGAELPIWISDYVLMDYGTGAIMAVPGHDARDYEFARKFDLPIVRVIDGGELPYEGDGACVNSSFIDGLDKAQAIAKIVAFFEDKKIGNRHVQYKFRDWLFSRQRFWGEPFPVVRTQHGIKALPLKDLPVTLPSVADYQPTESGEAPLAKAPESWLKAKDPETGESATRETDTMPGSAGSSWYFLRYVDPQNDAEPFSFAAQDYFMPVDLYLGGAEHTVGHLMYARFWQKVLYDEGLVSHPEPFKKLVHQGMILGEDGEKMSKSRGNVVNPDDVVVNYGADALRVYEMFMGPLERDKPWSQNGLVGVYKFLNKVWRLCHAEDETTLAVDGSVPSPEMLRLTHQTIKKVTLDLESLAFNTAVSQLMIFVNEMGKHATRPLAVIKPFLQCLAPFAPHVAEEIWQKIGETGFVSVAPWPAFDPALAKSDTVTIAVQVNGKTRAKLDFDADAEQGAVEAAAKLVPSVHKALEEGQPLKKVIFVKNRIINLIF
jgi:leucyl-tRNA synthetase